ncbi:DUF2071 domain-containing protein [Streptomyces cadmiisoli]|uniref:DUF2071 domain-containing protein n=1 Tax=Streptomyces cadmiisoli TaxID=2184053 RepID=UPI00365B2B8F
MVAYRAEQRVRLAALRAGWLTQTFVHWSFPVEAVQTLAPEPLAVDEYEGAGWVGLTPFAMADVRLPGVPAKTPGLPTLPETSLRTYVRHPSSGRRGAGGASYRLVVRPGAPIERPTERDVWLTSRWRAYTRRLGMLRETPVEHEPWPLASAGVEVLEETLVASAGFSAPSGDPVMHFSEEVRHVRLGASLPARRRPSLPESGPLCRSVPAGPDR